METETIKLNTYDSSTGKYRRTCFNPNCVKHYWGRKDQQYCSLRCKNQVNNAKWRIDNPKLTDLEKEIRRNYRVLSEIARTNGYNKWLAQTILAKEGFNGKLYHSYTESVLDAGTHCKVISIFDLKLYIADGGKILINKPI